MSLIGRWPISRRSVAAGTPEDIVREKRSYTEAFLKQVLAMRGADRGKKEAAE